MGRWTQAWRRMNKKGRVDDQGKKRTRKAQKFQKAIVGMSLEDIKKKKAQKPELRKQAQDAAAKEAKARTAKKPAAAKASAGTAGKAAKGGKKDVGGKQDKKAGGGGAGQKLKYQGSR